MLLYNGCANNCQEMHVCLSLTVLASSFVSRSFQNREQATRNCSLKERLDAGMASKGVPRFVGGTHYKSPTENGTHPQDQGGFVQASSL